MYLRNFWKVSAAYAKFFFLNEIFFFQNIELE